MNIRHQLRKKIREDVVNTGYPSSFTYPDVVEETVELRLRRGAPAPVRIFRPADGSAAPAVVMGQDATGFSSTNRRFAATLAHHGYFVAAPDYYRGGGPDDPESLDDIEGLIGHIDALDFAAESRLFHETVDLVASRPEVDAERIAAWGFCTGGTFALLIACLHPAITASVLYYPSQPRLPVVDDRRPVHPIDLLWNLTGPGLLIYGTDDPVMPAELLDEIRRRVEVWEVDLDIRTYAGAGHAFSIPTGGFHHPEAAQAAWTDAREFLDPILRPDPPGR